MNRHQNTERSLQSLAEEAMRLGRDLEAEAHAVYAGGSAETFGFVARSLKRFAERNPFDDRDDASVETLRGIFERDLAAEVIGIERRPVETHYDAMGQSYELRKIAIYTERGEHLLRVRDLLADFERTRAAALDAIAAERAIMRLLGA
ncbi:hypothetical protein RM543_10430 [Roseicyclus sp. F158]|uniref:Uncharacterized protein n=1 Tax=Tropicimonas omnivorans TaxID=3075590 RepID=A0ABU3DHB4_9RHOB|nr:hypothetical protein [Roseicyclus sp. F158]MDT0683103.1 hypothetical protein [Roseicyclus sp. F158]